MGGTQSKKTEDSVPSSVDEDGLSNTSYPTNDDSIQDQETESFADVTLCDSPQCNRPRWTYQEIIYRNLETEYEQETILEFETGNDITLYAALPENSEFESTPISHDERHALVKEGKLSLPKDSKLMTDVYSITRTLGDKCNGRKVLVRWSQSKPIPNAKYFDFHAIVSSSHQTTSEWNIIECQYEDSSFVFVVGQETFKVCIIAVHKKEKFTILPEGCTFTSSIDNNITISFPEGAVAKDETIIVQVLPIDDEVLVPENDQGIEDDVTDEAGETPKTEITSISPCLFIPHIEFSKDVQVQMPMLDIGGNDLDPAELQNHVFELTDDRQLVCTDTEAEVINGKTVFNVRSFSGRMTVTSPRSMSRDSVRSETERLLGLYKFCKILLFMKKQNEKFVNIIMECVEKSRVTSVIRARKSENGFNYIREWTSKDFYEPEGTVYKLTVGGKFKIPIDAKRKNPEFDFWSKFEDNFTHFGVEIDSTLGKVNGVITVWKGRVALYDIMCDPMAWKIFPEPLSHAVDAGGLSRFIDDRGLTRLAGRLEDVFEVCMNMNMTVPQYQAIYNSNQNIPVRKVILLRTAVNNQTANGRLDKLINALEQSGERLLADQIRDLMSRNKKLSDL